MAITPLIHEEDSGVVLHGALKKARTILRCGVTRVYDHSRRAGVATQHGSGIVLNSVLRVCG